MLLRNWKWGKEKVSVWKFKFQKGCSRLFEIVTATILFKVCWEKLRNQAKLDKTSKL